MDLTKRTVNGWISSVLKRHDLQKDDVVDLKACWARIEECQLLERIRSVVTEVNGTAGYHILDLLDFLPPQATIVRVAYSKPDTEYVMKIVVREGGAAVVFYSLRSGNRMTFLEYKIHPTETLTEDIQRWFSYLLSEFDKKRKPNAR